MSLDFASVFKEIHQLSLKNIKRQQQWSWIRWFFFFTPVLILLGAIILVFSPEDFIVNLVTIIIGIAWLCFILINSFVNKMLNNQVKIQQLDAIVKGDDNLPEMDWVKHKYNARAQKSSLLLLITSFLFLLYLTLCIIGFSVEDQSLASLASIGSFLILITIGLIIFQFELFFDLEVIQGDFFPKDVSFYSKDNIIDFVNCYLRPSAKADFQAFRKTLVRVAEEEGKLFFAHLAGLTYLHTKQIFLNDTEGEKTALSYDQLMNNLVDQFPREKMIENLQLFINVAQKRMRIDLVGKLSSIKRLGSIKDDQLSEVLASFLLMEPDGEFFSTFRKALSVTSFDRVVNKLFAPMGQDHKSLLCSIDSTPVISLSEKGALHLLFVNNTSKEKNLEITLICPRISPDRLSLQLRLPKGTLLDKLPGDAFLQLPFKNSSSKDLLTTSSIFFRNTQGFWIQLHPTEIGQFALKVTIVNTDTKELVSSYQTTIVIERDIVQLLRKVTGIAGIIAGPLISTLKVLLSIGAV
ncbi:MAG: hypothetical protein ACTSYA_10480 [Candidatus Kariarchaeaceae archaeon]